MLKKSGSKKFIDSHMSAVYTDKLSIVNILLTASAVLMILALIITPVAAYDEHPTGYRGVDNYIIPSLSENNDYGGIPALRSDSSSLPSQFDLRDVDGYGYVTSVKDQGDYGNCWAFSAIASAESNALKKYGDTSVDLSEAHLVYFMYNRDGVTYGETIPDELSGLSGDNVELTSGNPFYNAGGNIVFASKHLATGIGLVNESIAPYSGITNPIDKSKAMMYDSYYVTNSSLINKSDISAIKNMLMTNGCGVINYYHDENNYTHNEGSTAYYQNTQTGSNHAVTIAGWDDDYSKENFTNSPTLPQHDGAWLIKNSWGVNWGDGGYFWLSYEDTSINDIAFLEVERVTEPVNIYQYDGSAGVRTFSLETNSVTIKNRFTAAGSETIKAVSFATENTNVGYTVKINVNGVEKTEQSGSVTYVGYHNVHLNTPVNLKAGDVFEVVITMSVSNGLIIIPYDGTHSNGGWINFISHSEDGQGFILNGGSWVDINNVLSGETGQTNLRIKALTTPTQSAVASVNISYPFQNQQFNISDSGYANATVYDLFGNTMPYENVKWSSSNLSVMTVNETGYFNAVNSGNARINAKAVNNSTAVTFVDVSVKALPPVYHNVTFMPNNGTANWTIPVLNGTKLTEPVNPTKEGYNFVGWNTVTGYQWNFYTDIVTEETNLIANYSLIPLIPTTVNISYPFWNQQFNISDSGYANATVYDQFGDTMPYENVNWSSSNLSVMTVNETGYFNAVDSGKVRINAKAGNNSTAVTFVDVSVLRNPPVPTRIDLTDVVSSNKIEYLTTGNFSGAKVFDQYNEEITGTNATVKWESNTPDILNVTEFGAYNATGEGTVTIKATSSVNTSVFAEKSVTVEKKDAGVPVKVVIDQPLSTKIEYKTNGSLSAVVFNKYNEEISSTLTWSSNISSVISVDNNGYYNATYNEPGKNKNATIKASSTNASAFGELEVTVFRAVSNATNITITNIPVNNSIVYGNTAQLSAIVIDQYNEEIESPSVSWTSDNESIISVTSDGLCSAVGKGTAKITASSGTVNDTVTLVVKPVPMSIEFTGLNESQYLDIGDTGTLTTTIYDQSSDEISGAEYKWESNSSAVSIVESTGVYRAESVGTAKLTVKSVGNDTLSKSVIVTVIDPSVTITQPASTELYISENQTFIGTGVDVNLTTFEWNFDDGISNVSGNSINHTYNESGTYNVVLTAVSKTGKSVYTNRTYNVVYKSAEAKSVNVSAVENNVEYKSTGNFSGVVVYDQYERVMNNTNLVWSSSNQSVISVNSDYYTANAVGDSLITVKAGTVEGNFTAHVYKSPETAVRVNIASIPSEIEYLTTGSLNGVVVYDQYDEEITGTNATVIWSSNNISRLNVTESGEYNATGAGTVTIKAVSSVNSSVYDEKEISVFRDGDSIPVKVVINQPLSTKIEYKTNGSFSAVVFNKYNEEIDSTLTWSSDPSVIIVDNNGNYTVAYNEPGKNKNATVKASSTNASAFGELEVTVFRAVSNATNITINGLPEGGSVLYGATGTLTAEVIDQYNESMSNSVNWTSSHPDVIGITNAGVYTAGKKGSALITAASGTASASAVINVTAKPVKIDLICSDPDNKLVVDETAVFTATVYDQDGDTMSDAAVNWITSDPAILVLNSTTGLVSSYKAVAKGNATISVSAALNTSAVNSTLISVINPSVKITSPNDKAIFYAENDSINFTAVTEDLVSPTISWEFGDSEVASGSEVSHTYQFIDDIKYYTVNVTAESGEYKVKDSIVLTLKPAPSKPVRVELGTVPSGLNLSDKGTFTAKVYDQYGKEMILEKVNWNSSDKDVIIVDSSTGYYSAVSEGSAKITAVSVTNSSLSVESDSITVTKPASVASKMAVIPTDATFMVGDVYPLSGFKVFVYDQYGAQIPNPTVGWNSSNENVVVIDNGNIKAVSSGSASITAKVGELEKSVSLTIGEQVAAFMFLSVPETTNIYCGGVFSSLVLSSNGAEMKNAQVSWSSSNNDAVTVNASTGRYYVNTVTADTDVTITARCGTVTETANIRVIAPANPMPAINNVVLIPGNSLSLSSGQTSMVAAIPMNNTVGAIISSDVHYTWSSDNVIAANVVGNGLSALVKGNASGNANVNVTIVSGAVKDTAHTANRTIVVTVV